MKYSATNRRFYRGQTVYTILGHDVINCYKILKHSVYPPSSKFYNRFVKLNKYDFMVECTKGSIFYTKEEALKYFTGHYLHMYKPMHKTIGQKSHNNKFGYVFIIKNKKKEINDNNSYKRHSRIFR